MSPNPLPKDLPSVGGYELLHKIADGGMGVVYKGRDRTTGQVVAVKVVSLPPLVRNKEVLLKRFRKEFRAASSLDHPNIIRALDFGWEGGAPYLVMEYADGETLGARIEREGRLPEHEAVRIIVQVAQALEKVHDRGMVHRDVKPDNILLTACGQAKLTDLGLVKDLDVQSDLTRAGCGLGTPHFMAPEQFRNAKQADRRSDVYSLAATLYMAVTGELPFGGCKPIDAWMKQLQGDLPPPRMLVATLSERVDAAIRRAMSPEPRRRPASCHEFVNDLARDSGKTQARCEEASLPSTLPPVPEPRITGKEGSVSTQPQICPSTPSPSSNPQSHRETLKPPRLGDTGANTTGRSSERLTWLLIALGVLAGLLSGFFFVSR